VGLTQVQNSLTVTSRYDEYKEFLKIQKLCMSHQLTYLQFCSTTSSQRKQGVCHTVALPFTLKSILRKKNNYQIIHHAKIQSSQNPLNETKILQDGITL
jgi:hypothetical protein